MSVKPWLILVFLGYLVLSPSVWALEDDQQSSTNTTENRWFLKLDLTGIIFNVSGTVKVRGTSVSGASVSLTNSASISGDLGYFVTSNVALDIGFGYPPQTTVDGKGTLSFIGAGARSRYAPVAILVQYHLNDLAPIRPFIGVGPAYSMFFDKEPKTIRSPRVENAWGAALQGGLDYDLSADWGANFELIKIFSSTTASGVVAGTPATADVRVNTLIIRSGLTLRF